MCENIKVGFENNNLYLKKEKLNVYNNLYFLFQFENLSRVKTQTWAGESIKIILYLILYEH